MILKYLIISKIEYRLIWCAMVGIDSIGQFCDQLAIGSIEVAKHLCRHQSTEGATGYHHKYYFIFVNNLGNAKNYECVMFAATQ